MKVGDQSGRFAYAGPTILHQHGIFHDSLAENCLGEIRDADVLFAWIDRPDTVGTLVEIVAMRARGRPIFLAFANDELRRAFYFVDQLATVSIIAPDAMTAWRCFVRWMNR